MVKCPEIKARYGFRGRVASGLSEVDYNDELARHTLTHFLGLVLFLDRAKVCLRFVCVSESLCVCVSLLLLLCVAIVCVSCDELLWFVCFASFSLPCCPSQKQWLQVDLTHCCIYVVYCIP